VIFADMWRNSPNQKREKRHFVLSENFKYNLINIL